MNEDFVTYKIAVKLREKGFYYKCVATYDNDGMLGYNYIQPTNIRAIGFDDCLCSHNVENDNCVDAPTISQVLKWLREEHKIYMYVERDTYHLKFRFVYEKDKPRGVFTSSVYDKFEQAALAGIEYVIDNLI